MAKIALLYLLGKPKHWRLRINDIKKKLGCGTSKAYKVLAELRAKGFAVMVRGQQKVEWFFYSKPKSQPAETRAESQSVKFQRVEICDDLDSIKKPESIENYNNPPDVPEPIQRIEEQDVVVEKEVEVAVPHIPPQHQLPAKRSLSQLPPEQAQAVLVAFTLAISKGGIKSPIGYLMQLVKAAIDGTFSPVGVAGGAPVQSLDDRLAKERARQEEQQKRGAMTVDQHAEWLATNFGSKPAEGKAGGRKVGLKDALGWA